MATRILSDLPVETLREVVNQVDQVDAICLALSSHQLLSVVLVAKGATTIKELSPGRPSTSHYLCLTVRWCGGGPESAYEELMSRLWF